MKIRTINIHEAKTHLSRFVEQAAAGAEIVIAKAGRPRARLIAYAPASKPRRPGSMKGRIRVRSDFDDPLPTEIATAFEVK
jgi:prevent-host-death family protein